VASERYGRWHAAVASGGPGVGQDGNTEIDSVSCPSAGNCGVGGAYAPGPFGGNSASVASEINGRWAKAAQVPGIAALGSSDAWVNSVSCPSSRH